MSRECSDCTAKSFGGDWLIVQYKMDGEPIACWKLEDTAVTNEPNSDGVYWKAPGGHLVHISGWYNRVQVDHSDFVGAAAQLGIDLEACKGGKYIPHVTTLPEVRP